MLNKIVSIRFGERYAGNKGNIIGFFPASYWGSDDYFINEEDSVCIKKTLDILTKSTTTAITKKDIIYTTKSSEIPRFKLKEFTKENGVKKTTRHAYANIFIINRGTFNELISRLKIGNHLFLNEDMIIDKNIKDWFHGNGAWGDHAMNIVKSDKANKNQLLHLIIDDQKKMDQLFKKHPAHKNIFDNSYHVEEGIVLQVYREAKLVELFNLIVNNANKIINGEIKFVWDEDLFVNLNKEGIELDDDYLQTLRDMLFSKDESNVKLGFEMMSNLVLDQPTLLTISFLLNELFHTTKFRPSYYINNNSNLKALLKLLKTKGIAWDRDWKMFGSGLRMNFKTGVEGNIVKKFLLDNINREFKLHNSAAEALIDIVFATETK